jgi:hypothetical protein
MKTRLAVYVCLLVAILALAIQGDTAQGKINDDSTMYVPIVMKQPNQTQPNAPSGALYVFFSTGTTNGNGGGRVGMNAICANSDSSSHFCSRNEIENAWFVSGVYFNTPISESGWMDAPYQFGTITTDTNGYFKPSSWASSADCFGWTYDNSGGNIVQGYKIYNGGTVNSSVCSENLKVA